MLHLWCYRDNRISIDKLECMVYKVLANGQQQEVISYYFVAAIWLSLGHLLRA